MEKRKKEQKEKKKQKKKRPRNLFFTLKSQGNIA